MSTNRWTWFGRRLVYKDVGFAPGWYKAGPSALNITAKSLIHAFSSAESAARYQPGAEPQDLR
jgi:hypothetical protein